MAKKRNKKSQSIRQKTTENIVCEKSGLQYTHNQRPLSEFEKYPCNKMLCSWCIFVYDAHNAKITALNSPRLPWLHNEIDYQQQELDKCLLKDIRSASSLEEILKETLRNRLNSFSMQIDIDADFRWLAADPKADQALDYEHCNFVNFDRQILDNIQNLEKKNVTIDVGEIYFSPASTEFSFNITLPQEQVIYISKIEFIINIYDWSPVVFTVDINEANYGFKRSIKTNTMLKDFLFLKQNSDKLKKLGVKIYCPSKYLDFSVEFPTFSFDPSINTDFNKNVAIFIDMGSTATKYIVAQTDHEGKVKDIVKCVRPIDTVDFCAALGTEFNKEEMITKSAEFYASWLSNVISRLPVYLNLQDKTIVNVYWSFPAIEHSGCEKEFFCQVESLVSKSVGTVVLNGIILIEEHKTLEFMFGGVLKKLVSIAELKKRVLDKKNLEINRRNSQKKEQYDKECANINKENSGFWHKLFGKDDKPLPQRPHLEEESSLPEYYTTYLQPGCKNGLRNYVILDAGGCSFDIYGVISSTKEVHTYQKSLRAGGQTLTSMIQQYKNCSWERAELEKIAACEDEKPLTEFCRQRTKDIYEKNIRDICDFISENIPESLAQGIAIILTGRGFKNKCLRDLLYHELDSRKISYSLQITDKIAEAIIEAKDFQRNMLLKMFLQIACNNDVTHIPPASDLDVCGGMLLMNLQVSSSDTEAAQEDDKIKYLRNILLNLGVIVDKIFHFGGEDEF